MPNKYKRLQITARDAATEIWVGDDEGNLVQKEVGRMDTHLLPGRYTVEFGLGTEQRVIDLQDDLDVHEVR
ncbi:MAG: hypothetical protein WD669_03160 [Pirellulales bacterium]